MTIKRFRQDPKTLKLVYVGEFKDLSPGSTYQVGDLEDIQKDINRRKYDKDKADRADRRAKIVHAVEHDEMHGLPKEKSYEDYVKRETERNEQRRQREELT